jgi:hypothetical protein
MFEHAMSPTSASRQPTSLIHHRSFLIGARFGRSARLPNGLLAALRARFPTCSQSAFEAGILPFQQVT